MAFGFGVLASLLKEGKHQMMCVGVLCATRIAETRHLIHRAACLDPAHIEKNGEKKIRGAPITSFVLQIQRVHRREIRKEIGATNSEDIH